MKNRRRMMKIMMAPLAFLMVTTIAIVGYAAWLGGNQIGNGALTTGTVNILNINAAVNLTSGQTANRLVPITQPTGTFNATTHARALQFTVNVTAADGPYTLTLNATTINEFGTTTAATLANGSQLRVATTEPTAIDWNNGAPVLPPVGATTLIAGTGNVHTPVVIATNTAATPTVPGTHTFWLYLISDDTEDMALTIDFTVTIAPHYA